jgi:DNA-binding transcriptional regulator GbsR (MarR family)
MTKVTKPNNRQPSRQYIEFIQRQIDETIAMLEKISKSFERTLENTKLHNEIEMMIFKLKQVRFYFPKGDK